MEAVEDCLASLRRHPGSLVVDADPDFVADMCDGNLHESASRREAHGIVDDIVDRPGEPVRLTHDLRTCLAWACEGYARITLLTARFPALDELLDQGAEIDPLELGSSELGVGPRRLANVVDEAVEANDVVARHHHQPLAKRRVLDRLEPVHCGAQ